MQQFLVYIIGPAGAGKSSFTEAFRDWLKSQETPVSCVNLDPAVENLNYDPEVDVREYVFTREIMDKYSLGPNGAIIASMDLLLEHLARIDSKIEELGEGYVLIDTPGQMEIFAFRKSGKYLVEALCRERRCATVFLGDSMIVDRPGDLLSQLMMAASIYYRFSLPMTTVLNKVDLLSPPERGRLEGWVSSPETFEEAVMAEKFFTRNMFISIKDFLETLPPILVSSKKFIGFEEVYVHLHGIYMGGEDFERTTSLVEGE